MTARLFTTVYDPDDLPTEVAHIASKSLGTVNAWTELEYQHVRKGTGSFKGKINRHHSQAALLVAGRYLIFHSDAGPIGGAWLEEAPIDLSAEQGKGDEWAGWQGRGAIAILERGRLLHTHYSTDPAASPFRGNVDHDGVWEWINAVAANIYYGGVLARSVEEGQDEPGNPLAVVSMWGTDGADRRVNDASGTPWTGIAEAFRTDIGNHVLDLAHRFSQFDVITQMSYLFRLDAYNEANFGTDRSGAFGAATVRLEKGVNIAASIQRKVRGEVARTHLLVGGADYTYVTVVHPDYVPGEPAHYGFLSVPETSDPADLAAIGLDHLRARDSQTDAWVLPLKHHGDDPENGIYEPAPDIADGHFWVGDTISFHTGTGEYDANEQSAPVAAITWQLKTGDEANGDYRVIVEVGSTFHWEAGESFSGGAPGSQTKIQLCQPSTLAESFAAVGSLGSACSNDGTNPASDFPAWAGDQEERVEVTVSRGVPAGHSIVVWVATNEDGGQGGLYDHQVYDEQGNTWTLDDQSTPQGSNDIVVEIWRCNVTTALNSGDYIRFAMNVGSSLSTSVEGGRRCIAAYEFTGSLTVPSVGTGGNGFSGSPTVASSATGGLVVAGLTTGGGDPTYDADWENAVDIISSTLSLVGQFLIPGANESWTPSYSGSSTDWSITTIGYTAGAGTAGAVNDGHPDLVGDDPRAARCDHRHDVHRDTAPTANDDWATAGYKLGTIWAQLDDLTTPTEIVGVWMLVDDSEGAAVWLEWPGGSPTAADVSITDTGGYYTGTDVEAALQENKAADIAHAAAADPHTGYVKESEFTAAGDLLVGTGSATLTRRKNNMTATAAPTTGDDSGDGYAVGSLWYDTTNDKAYTALDVTVAAAVWKEITASPTGGTVTVQEEDGSPTGDFDTIKFPNGSVTDNGDGSVSVSTSGGSGTVRKRVATSQTSTSTTFADVTALTFPVTSGKTYHFRFVVFFFTAAATTGLRLSVNGPTTSALRFGGITPSAAAGNSTAMGNQQTFVFDNAIPLTTSGPGATGVMALVEGTAVFTASGTLALRFASEVGGSQVAIEDGSYGEITEIV